MFSELSSGALNDDSKSMILQCANSSPSKEAKHVAALQLQRMLASSCQPTAQVFNVQLPVACLVQPPKQQLNEPCRLLGKAASLWRVPLCRRPTVMGCAQAQQQCQPRAQDSKCRSLTSTLQLQCSEVLKRVRHSNALQVLLSGHGHHLSHLLSPASERTVRLWLMWDEHSLYPCKGFQHVRQRECREHALLLQLVDHVHLGVHKGDLGLMASKVLHTVVTTHTM